MSGRRLLVTGGAGFIGSNFVRHVLGAHPDDTIVVLDKLTYAGNRENLRDLEGPRYQFVQGDIADPDLVRDLIRDCHHVVNFAAETHVDRSIMDPDAFLRTNILGTRVLLDAALAESKRDGNHLKIFLHISTDEVYGSATTDGAAFQESDPLRPNSPYAASKAAADLLVRAYQVTYGLRVAITRSSNNYGPYQFPEKFIPLAITNALDNEPIPLYGDGLYYRDWLHVEDNCRAIDLVLTSAHDEGEQEDVQIFNIGAGRSDLPNFSVLKAILRLLGKPESLITRVADRPGHDRRYALDVSKLTRDVRWTPSRSFEQGLAQTIDWYRTHEAWWRPLKQRPSLHWLRAPFTTSRGRAGLNGEQREERGGGIS